MASSDIKDAIVAGLSDQAVEYWINTTDKNDFVGMAQTEGLDRAIAAVEDCAREE